MSRSSLPRVVSILFSVFPGVHTVELYRGLDAAGITHITPAMSKAPGFMADGYAKGQRQAGGVFYHLRPGHDEYPHRHGAGLWLFYPHAGDFCC